MNPFSKAYTPPARNRRSGEDRAPANRAKGDAKKAHEFNRPSDESPGQRGNHGAQAEGDAMSIEAMSKAYEALNKSRPFDADNARMQRDAMDALRTAIQQAEAKTDEPVAWMWKFEGEDGAAFSRKKPTISIRYGVNYVPLYTHPAPGVPDADFDLICNAIDKADTLTMEGDYMLDSDDCIAVVRVMQALLSVRAAMLTAAQSQKGQP